MEIKGEMRASKLGINKLVFKKQTIEKKKRETKDAQRLRDTSGRGKVGVADSTPRKRNNYVP